MIIASRIIGRIAMHKKKCWVISENCKTREFRAFYFDSTDEIMANKALLFRDSPYCLFSSKEIFYWTDPTGGHFDKRWYERGCHNHLESIPPISVCKESNHAIAEIRLWQKKKHDLYMLSRGHITLDKDLNKTMGHINEFKEKIEYFELHYPFLLLTLKENSTNTYSKEIQIYHVESCEFVVLSNKLLSNLSFWNTNLFSMSPDYLCSLEDNTVIILNLHSLFNKQELKKDPLQKEEPKLEEKKEKKVITIDKDSHCVYHSFNIEEEIIIKIIIENKEKKLLLFFENGFYLYDFEKKEIIEKYIFPSYQYLFPIKEELEEFKETSDKFIQDSSIEIDFRNHHVIQCMLQLYLYISFYIRRYNIVTCNTLVELRLSERFLLYVKLYLNISFLFYFIYYVFLKS
jgi:hypothetical protein